jgi:hypothetical protein
MSYQIKRKAVPERDSSEFKAQLTASPVLLSPSDDPPPEYDFTNKVENPVSPIIEGEVRPDLDKQLEHLHLETGHGTSLASPVEETSTEEPGPTQAGTTTAKGSKFKYAIGEIKHFAGGLITHPYEATKHYSVLRHSHGFVFYQGPTTSVAITVLSDQPLPLDRKLWLQKRGFSGKTGMKVGTLGTRSAWIDVTPSIDATADLLPPDNERAWQRDIAKFIKKARNTKNLSNHCPYETHIVRIPHVAEDGYFRIVLCAGRKVLCPSPIFRYASSSLDPSVLRGASLRTLPLELGVRVGSLVAHSAANTAAAGALQPAVSTVQNVVQPYQYGGVTRWATSTAYNSSGAADRVNSTVESINQQYGEKRELEARSATGGAEDIIGLVGGDDGPEAPYPIRFSAKVAPGFQTDKQRSPGPTARLVDVPQDTLLRLSGIYIGWASLSKTKGISEPSIPNEALEKWFQAVITVTPERDKTVAVVETKRVDVHILHDFVDAFFFNTKVSLTIMGCIRPADYSPTSAPDLESQQKQFQDDISIVERSLNRVAWQPDAVLERIKSASSGRSFTERVADARQTGQKQLDRVPVHRLGVRTNSMGLKDQLIGNGGICIRR